jgi:hypothetical protein
VEYAQKRGAFSHQTFDTYAGYAFPGLGRRRPRTTVPQEALQPWEHIYISERTGAVIIQTIKKAMPCYRWGIRSCAEESEKRG